MVQFHCFGGAVEKVERVDILDIPETFGKTGNIHNLQHSCHVSAHFNYYSSTKKEQQLYFPPNEDTIDVSVVKLFLL